MRAQILSDEDLVTSEHIEFDDINGPFLVFGQTSHTESRAADLSETVKQSEYAMILDTINKSSTREQAAKQLGISPRTLRHKLQKMREDAPQRLANA
jgi:two-component system response regulator FlrC